MREKKYMRKERNMTNMIERWERVKWKRESWLKRHNNNNNSMLIVQYPMQFSGPPRNKKEKEWGREKEMKQ